MDTLDPPSDAKSLPYTDDSEDIQLSESTLQALQGFYTERDVRQKHFEDLANNAEDDFAQNTLSMDTFTEDWNASQFWYTDECAALLAYELLRDSGPGCRIAVVSAPSVFVQMKNVMANLAEEQRPDVYLFEFDSRFAVFKEFVQYDYNQPIKLPENLKASFHRIICDPPFLSSDCHTRAATTVRWLSHPSTEKEIPRIIVCTGERMSDLVLKLYCKCGLRNTDYTPAHSKGLSNEFCCFANFDGERWRLV